MRARRGLGDDALRDAGPDARHGPRTVRPASTRPFDTTAHPARGGQEDDTVSGTGAAGDDDPVGTAGGTTSSTAGTGTTARSAPAAGASPAAGPVRTPSGSTRRPAAPRAPRGATWSGDFSHAQGDRPELAVTGADLGEAGRRTSSLTGGGGFGAPGRARFFPEGGHAVVEADTPTPTCGWGSAAASA